MLENEKDFTMESYLEYLQSKKLMGSKCRDCGEIYVPSRKLCTKCNSTNLEWIKMSGNGKLAAFSCIGVGATFMTDKGYSLKNPYCFSVIKLDEGPMISGQLIGVDEKHPETIQIGTSVKVKFLETDLKGETRIDLGFEPA